MTASLTLFQGLAGHAFVLLWPFGYLFMGGFGTQEEARSAAERFANTIGRTISGNF